MLEEMRRDIQQIILMHKVYIDFVFTKLRSLRDHILAGLLPLMARTPVTAQLYDEPSFLRNPHYLTYLSKLLTSLNDFKFNLEKSLTYGFD